MPDVRNLLVTAVRQDVAAARGAARASLAATRDELRRARVRLQKAQRDEATAPAALGKVRDKRLAEAAQRHRDRVASLAAEAARVADTNGVDAAVATWDIWEPLPLARGKSPGPLRLGEVRLGDGDGHGDAGVAGCPPVPALVPLLDRAHLVIEGDPDPVLPGILLRILGGAKPGEVRLIGYDPERLGGGLAAFAPLAPAGLLTFIGPGGLAGLLDELVEEIRRINETVLAGEYGSLRELASETGRRPEPWRVAVLLGPSAQGTGSELSRHEQAQLDRIIRAGVACGVHVIACGVPVRASDGCETVTVTGPRAATATVSASLPITLDRRPRAELVTGTCRAIAEEYAAGPTPASFTDLLPEKEKYWTESAAAELVAPIGEGRDGRLVEVKLGDHPPHALIGGPSGAGKTNLIYAWMGSLSARYGPDELEFYLLDFKEGVSFARFAPGRRDTSWLPQVRLVGINVNTDREFGLALLRFLGEELRRRADAAKRFEVTKLSELRVEDPSGHWPRIVAVVDEFQVLLAGRDALAGEAVGLLEDLARRGRSQGIHLVLASQDVSGIEALWGRSALVAQFTLRIALPKARRILQETNPAAEQIPRHHAVVNPDSGAPGANRIVRIPEAGDRATWGDLQQRLWRMRPSTLVAPRLFDGDAVPNLPPPAAIETSDRRAVVGERIDVQSQPAAMRWSRAPGRNLAVLGTRVEEACAVLSAAARSLAWPHPAGVPRFSVVSLDTDAATAARGLYQALPPGTGLYVAEDLTELLASVAAELTGPHVLVLYAVDAAAGLLAAKVPGGASGHENLRKILHNGPERNVHVLGWWRSVARLRDDLGGVGARFDSIGAWVALDVHGAELSPLATQPGGPNWYPRPWRGLFFDRSVHRLPEVIIPYGVSG